MAFLVDLSLVLPLLCHLNTSNEAVLCIVHFYYTLCLYTPENTRFCQDDLDIPHYLMVTLWIF